VATYSGNPNNVPPKPAGCADTSEQVQITPHADPQLTSSASGAIALGGAVHDTAHLSGGNNPTGTITFKLYPAADRTCSGHPEFTSTGTVSGNGDYTSRSLVPSAAGDYRWVASYSGDSSNHPAGPTGCGDTAETATVRPAGITPDVPTFSTTTSRPDLGGPLHDTAHLAGGVDPGGTITFELYGPDDQTCSKPPAFVTTVAVSGNGDYRSPAFVIPVPGTYRWVVTYSGDVLNAAVGPTACGDPAEIASVSATPTPNLDPGPNVPTPPKLHPKPKPNPKPTRPPRPAPPPPAVTG